MISANSILEATMAIRVEGMRHHETHLTYPSPLPGGTSARQEGERETIVPPAIGFTLNRPAVVAVPTIRRRCSVICKASVAYINIRVYIIDGN